MATHTAKELRSGMSAEELAQIETAFMKYTNGTGILDHYMLQEALRAVGLNLSEGQVRRMILDVDSNGTDTLDHIDEFIHLLHNCKEPTVERALDAPILDAFVAMGGNPDKSGEISTMKLGEYFQLFELNIDIQKLARDIDTDNSGMVDYDEFKALLDKAKK